MSADRLKDAERLPKPSWATQIPNKELDAVRRVVQPKSFEPAYDGIEFLGRDLDQDTVAEVALILAETSEQLYNTKGAIAFFRYGDKKRQVILPLRRSNVSPREALNVLNNIIRLSTPKLDEHRLPVVELPPFVLNPFLLDI